MMRKCIISLLFSTFFLSFCSQNHLTAQVYNQKMDKRFDPNFKTEQAYYKYIHKVSNKVYSDYYQLLDEMITSGVPEQMEYLRKDQLRSLENIRRELNYRNDYDVKFPLKRSLNILIDKYEDIYNSEIARIIDIYDIKENEDSKLLKERKYQKQIFGIFRSMFSVVPPALDATASLTTIEGKEDKPTVKKEENTERELPDYDNIYETDLKNLSSTFDLQIDTLPVAKSYHLEFSRLQIKSSEARSTFEVDFKKFESGYSLQPETEDDFTTYSVKQKKHYSLLNKLDFIEDVNVYILDIFISVHKLESIDKDFRSALEDYNLELATLIRKYMNHHAEIAYQKLKNTSKFNGKEGDFRSAATRLIKYYQSSGKNTYPKILAFAVKNKTALTKEKKNQEEFERMSEDANLHESKQAYREYLNFPPPQKNTTKLELLIKKYRERLQDSTEDFTLSLEELREKFNQDFDPLDN